MKIMSLNVNRFEAEHIMSGGWTMSILRIAREFLDRHSDGVVFLYEVPRKLKAQALEKELQKYKVISFGNGHVRTVAITRKRKGWSPCEQDRFVAGFNDKKKENYRNRHVEVINNSKNRNRIRVLGIHAPDDFEFLEEIEKYARKYVDQELIILGDFNIATNEDRLQKKKDELKAAKEQDKIKDCEDFFRRREWILKSMTSIGYFDVVESNSITFFPGKTCIDHVLISPRLKGRVTARVEEDIILSDHAVIIVNIEE